MSVKIKGELSNGADISLRMGFVLHPTVSSCKFRCEICTDCTKDSYWHLKETIHLMLPSKKDVRKCPQKVPVTFWWLTQEGMWLKERDF